MELLMLLLAPVNWYELNKAPGGVELEASNRSFKLLMLSMAAVRSRLIELIVFDLSSSPVYM